MSLFDVKNKVLIPTEHCYALNFLKVIMEEYPDCYIEVYKYIYYMCSVDPDNNPFFNVPEDDKEEVILSSIDSSGFSTEDTVVREAIEQYSYLEQTATARAYKGIKSMLDRLSDYMANTNISHGRDGNITALLSAAEKFHKIRESYKGVYQDLLDETKSRVKGNRAKSYDQ
jgi:hypothetical protein